MIYAYDRFINEKIRKESLEVDFGVWWGLTERSSFNDKWRVSWIENTGELYACCERKNIAIVLGIFKTRKEVEERMKGWSDEKQVLKDFFNIPESILKDLEKMGIK